MGVRYYATAICDPPAAGDSPGASAAGAASAKASGRRDKDRERRAVRRALVTGRGGQGIASDSRRVTDGAPFRAGHIPGKPPLPFIASIWRIIFFMPEPPPFIIFIICCIC